ncbi:MAG: sulfurtransferase [Rhodocyclaceae bacterium]|jgi:rhodanese-related sulfurtransferase|nr:sulfurtransferase [Rhodocyclaceae bacterium]MCP5296178.1 sulfurtransferase [Zoogloeaceae bacterium]PKO72816.1 MAG: sulfurtransferase [Betaproteobacteria bacterium HGW-Betaproteobacteria-14]
MVQITANELSEWLQDGERPAPLLLDVREPDEFAAYRIEGSTLIPMRTIPARLHELDRSADVVMICRSGARSYHAGMFLKQNGFERVYNLAGGVIAWSRDVARAAA